MARAGRTFRVFVSSTFSDLKAERNALQEHVFPRLRDLCVSYGARFQAIDLRWGVSVEAGLDQRTMRICLKELERCRQVTPRPNFIVLLGDRYGWEPLPEEIPDEQFRVIQDHVASSPVVFDEIAQSASGEDALGLLDKWYRRDDNNIPPAWVLQPRTGEYKKFGAWEELAERPIREIFRRAVAALGFDEDARLPYETSATHQEIHHGALSIPDKTKQVYGYYRSLSGLSFMDGGEVPEGLEDYVDTQADHTGTLCFSETGRKRALSLQKELEAIITEDNVRWHEATISKAGVSTTHIGEIPAALDDCLPMLEGPLRKEAPLCEQVWYDLGRIIRSECEAMQDVDTLRVETRAHAEFRNNLARIFVGRTDLLEEIRCYLADDRRQPLVVHGLSGCGKSALVAEAVATADRARSSGEVLLERFIGATPRTTHIRSLLEDLCRVLDEHYEGEVFAPPEKLSQLVDQFSERLNRASPHRPLLLFLDALNQLSDDDDARCLGWLPTELPPHVKLVVSTIDDDAPCFPTLKSKLPKSQFLNCKSMSREDGAEILDALLEDTGRRLRDDQRMEVLDKFTGNGLPLYMKLAFEEARLWRFWDGVPSYDGERGLAPDIPGILENLFWRLSKPTNHGPELVSRSLGYLAASRKGLTEDELIEILTLDDEFVEEYRTHPFHPTSDQVPAVVWIRLYSDLEPYLCWRAADGTALLGVYHSRVDEYIRDRFLNEDVRQPRHLVLTDYFYPKENFANQGRRRRPNMRRCSELPFQALASGQWDRLMKAMSDIWFVEAKCAAGKADELNEEFQRALSMLPHLRVEIDHRAERRKKQHSYLESLCRRPHQTAGDTARAESTPREHSGGMLEALQLAEMKGEADINEARSRVVQAPSPIETFQVFAAFVKANRHRLSRFGFVAGHAIQTAFNFAREGPVHEAARRALEVSPDLVSILRAAPSIPPFSIYPAILAGFHSDSAEYRCHGISADGRILAVGNSDGTIHVWHVDTGERLGLHVCHKGEVRCLALGLLGQRVITGGKDCCIRVLDLRTGKLELSLDGHEHPISCLAVSPDFAIGVSGDDEGWLHAWDLRTGRSLFKTKAHEKKISRILVSVDGQDIFSYGERDAYAKRWALNDNTCVFEKKLGGIHHGGSLLGREVLIPTGTSLMVKDRYTGESITTFLDHATDVTSFALTLDGTRAVSGDKDGVILVWNTATGEQAKRLEGENPILAMDISADGSRCATIDEYHCQVLDLENTAPGRALTHIGPVESILLSQDESVVVSASYDGAVCVWNHDTMECVHRFQYERGSIDRIQLALVGTKLLVPLRSGNAVLLDIHSGRCIREFHDKEATTKWYLHPSGSWVVSSSNTRVRIWEIATGKFKHEWEMEAFSKILFPNESEVLAYRGTELQCWELETGKSTGRIRDRKGRLVDIEFFSDTRTVVSVQDGPGDTAILWSLETGDLRYELDGTRLAFIGEASDPPRSVDRIHRFTFVKSGAPLEPTRSMGHKIVHRDATHPENLLVRCTETGALLHRLEGENHQIFFRKFPDGARLVSFEHKGAIKIWCLDTGRLIRRLHGHRGLPEGGYLAFSPNGERLLTWHRGEIVLWDTGTGEIQYRFNTLYVLSHVFALSSDCTTFVSATTNRQLISRDMIAGTRRMENGQEMRGRVATCAALSLDGAIFVLGFATGEIDIRYTKADRKDLSIEMSSRLIGTVHISQDGRFVTCSSGDAVHEFDLEKRATTFSRQHDSRIDALTSTLDGNLIVFSGAAPSLHLVDRRSGEHAGTISAPHRGDVGELHLLPDGRRVFAERGVGGSPYLSVPFLADLEEREVLATLKPDSGVITCADPSPDGRFVAFGMHDGRLELHSTRSGILFSLEGHDLDVTAVRMTPCGRYLASSSRDETIQIWDLAECNRMYVLRPEAGMVFHVSFSLDGRWLYSKCADGGVYLWSLESGELQSAYWHGMEGKLTNVSAEGVFAVGKHTRTPQWLRTKNLPRRSPIVTCQRIWRFGEATGEGSWSPGITALCPWCMCRFEVPPTPLECIEELVPNGWFESDTPCYELPDELWKAPELESSCPSCEHAIRYNPYIVDSLRHEPPNLGADGTPRASSGEERTPSSPEPTPWSWDREYPGSGDWLDSPRIETEAFSPPINPRRGFASRILDRFKKKR